MVMQLTLRNEIPLGIKALLLILLATVATLYVINARWFESLGFLLLLPVQRFSWQSEQFSGNVLFRGSSFILMTLCFSLFIYIYELGLGKAQFGLYHYPVLLSMVLGVVLFKYLVNSLYFRLHRIKELGSQLLDFQSSINQIFCLALATLMVVDVFYAYTDSNLFYVGIVLAVIYFLMRLYGTILILQNDFHYPIVSLFIYLCTFEIAPALVLAKVLFVKS